MSKRQYLNVDADKQNYVSWVRLTLDNFLQLEESFFIFCEKIYIYDGWEIKKNIFSPQLANLHHSICVGIEESVKLMLINPKNNLINDFVEFLKTVKNCRKDIVNEVINQNLDNVKLVWILDFFEFREKLNKLCDVIIFSRIPFRLLFKDLFAISGKPKWYQVYEDSKHNFNSKYSLVTLDLVFEALASFYMISKVLAHEGAYCVSETFKNGYTPWYQSKLMIDWSFKVGATRDHLGFFNSSYFEPTNFSPN